MPESSLMIIGGSGFFGKSILDALSRQRIPNTSFSKIWIVSRSASQFVAQNPWIHQLPVEPLDVNVGTVDSLPSADLVIHAAAATDARCYEQDPVSEVQNMVNAVDNFCRIAKQDLINSRIVFASSGAVYGTQDPHTLNLSESDPLASLEGLGPAKSAYAQGKRRCETLIQRLGEQHGLKVSIARCFAFLGRYLPLDQHFAVGNFIADGLAGRPIEVKARFPVYRTYMHADDLAYWLISLAKSADSGASVYNVGSDQAVTVNELAHRVAKITGTHVFEQSFNVDRIDRYVPSIDKAKTELGLELRFGDVDSALRDVISRLKQDSVA